MNIQLLTLNRGGAKKPTQSNKASNPKPNTNPKLGRSQETKTQVPVSANNSEESLI